MILLVDNYDSFTYNLAQYIGKFDEVQVLRNDDPDLYQVAQEADALVFSPGPGWPKDAGKMEEMIRDFAGVKPILGICLGHQAIAEVFGGRLGLAPQVMHGKQSQIQLEAPSPLYAGVAKEVPVMRYHSLTIEDMPEDFVITSRTRMIKRLWEFNTAVYRFMVFNTIQKVSGRQMGSRPSKILSN